MTANRLHRILFSLIFIQLSCSSQKEIDTNSTDLASEFKNSRHNILNNWYPLMIDSVKGGYYSQVTNNFELGEKHDKMIVSQARHLWTNSKAIQLYPDNTDYSGYAHHGFKFLKEVMWDSVNGGFHSLVTRIGEPILLSEGQKKTAYCNAFAIYGLATYYQAKGNKEALALAQKTFLWLEEHSHDPVHKGYFQSLDLDGTPIKRPENQASTSDVGYKDQNSTIHLLEAFTSLYEVWPNPLVAERLEELLILIRDNITTDKGYMRLFFTNDWTPVSFKNQSMEVIKNHYYLDHVSFGHDIETAYLMLEASHVLGLQDDTITLQTAKKMTDHAIKNGWDSDLGGLYDGGYYTENSDSIIILNELKNWWSQAEALNTLLIMSDKFPNDSINYRDYFTKLWSYTKTYMIDENGGWYEWGIDKTPESKDALRGHIWKANYHNFRAVNNIATRLREKKD